MSRVRANAMDLSTGVTFLLSAAVCYAAWLMAIVFCAANGARPLLIAAATFFPVDIVHGIGIWFGDGDLDQCHGTKALRPSR